ncbi:MAG: site-specific DNA-methyltransferase [Gemmatimonadales bacterium]|nr:site-specific DNA-methyltransferase [Gemmatimonadales bacterium]
MIGISMAKATKPKSPKAVETLTHEASKRKNIPTAEYSAMHGGGEEVRLRYPRNTDLDPQLVWRGKDEQDWSDLVVTAPPLYIQEKVHPKALIDDLLRQTREQQHDEGELMADLFADFNGIPKGADKTEFYQHDQNWSNRMILGDSLQVMASLAEREGLRGKVQCIYFDPPYGIKFNSNFQWSTTSRDVKDGNAAHITREPEQVKAFRDTWRDGIHSYLTYLRDRLTVARDLLTESGSIFVQIGDENVHRVRAVLDEVFGDVNALAIITVKKTAGLSKGLMPEVVDFVLWYAKDKEHVKRRMLFDAKAEEGDGPYSLVKESVGHFRRATREDLRDPTRLARFQILLAAGRTPSCVYPLNAFGTAFMPTAGRSWSSNKEGTARLLKADRIAKSGSTLSYVRFIADNPVNPISNLWSDTASGSGMDKIYVVQTSTKVIGRCILMATDPGDLVLDPTCGSGSTASVAEEWGRRWITIDTSRVALALARARLMASRYAFYLLADSREGQLREAELSKSVPSDRPTQGDIRQGFVYERVPHITLKSIANNTEIDVIWEKWEGEIAATLSRVNRAEGKSWREWEVPKDVHPSPTQEARNARMAWWEVIEARQREIDASIAAKAEYECLYDKPYQDNKKVRVAGPFTVESLSPHRMVGVDDGVVSPNMVAEGRLKYTVGRDFPSMILENLRTAGVQQAAKGDKIAFTALTPWPGDLVSAEGRYQEGAKERRAAIFIGPEFGTVTRPDLVEAAREAAEAGFDVLIACAFNFEAHTTEFTKLGQVPVLKARMNADLHMADELRKTDKANLFVIFGEPDIELLPAEQGRIKVKVNGIDVFDPSTGEVRSDDPDTIACWFIDTDYNEESFFVRHAYFLGANDPYKSLKTTLKAEINQDAWESLHSDVSRAFDKPKSGRIAVKVINHLGDEVMKVVRV